MIQEAVAIINSTPLWALSGDPNDPIALSPQDLVTQKPPLNTFAAPSTEPADMAAYGPRRWKRLQLLADKFWAGWRTYYLQSLQQRRRWLVPRPPVQPGDVVIIKDTSKPRLDWNLGIIRQAEASHDGQVRIAELHVVRPLPNGGFSRRTLRRPVHELVPLPCRP